MNKFKTSAIEILSKSKKPLHYTKITQLALESGILETSGATPESSMNSQLAMDIKTKGKASDFIRVSPGIFDLNRNKVEKISSKIIEKEEAEEEKIKIEGGYTGKGGEHLVCSELLFRGFNASIMSVDVGMDIIATKENKLFSIQVKTSNISSMNVYNFDVRKVSFDRNDSGNIFYVFVLHGQKENNYLILPFHEMEKKVHDKAILYVASAKKYRVVVKFREGNIYLGNMKHEMNYYLNNWGLIK